MIPKSLAEKATHRGQRVISLEMKHFACRAMAGSHVHMCPSSQAKGYSAISLGFYKNINNK